MKFKPLLFVFLLLFTPCLALADDSELTITQVNDSQEFENITIEDFNNMGSYFNYGELLDDSQSVEQTDNSETYEETTFESTSKIEDTTSQTDDESKMSWGASMIQTGIENTVISNVNDVFSSFGGLQLGSLNNSSEKDASQIAIFAVAAHTIDIESDPATMERITTMRDIYIYAILIFAGILALFLIYQILCPDESANLLEDVTGSYNYIAPSDMAKYYLNTCGWLLIGPAIFFGALKVNNILVEGQMLSVLDQVAFSSDHMGLYLIMGLLWLVSIAFFAVRLVLIILGAHIWIMNGLGLAFKKIRWAAILAIAYEIVFIFSQFSIVWICCIVVSSMASQALAWYTVSFVYLGLFLFVVSIEIIFVFWPLIWKILSPNTLITAIRVLRYM